MKQFHFSSNLSTLMELYLTTRNEEGYLSDHYGYYLQELDCLSKAMQNESFVTRELVEAWDAAKPYLSNRTKIQRHNTIRKFAAFAFANDGISYVPDTSKLKGNSTFVPHIFTVDEISRILNAADNLPYRKNAPTRHLVIPAVIRLLYSCGLRVNEALRLRTTDVNLESGVISIFNGKGGKDRLVPIHSSLSEYLREYTGKLLLDREWFFPSASGHYSSNTIYENFRELLFYEPYSPYWEWTSCSRFSTHFCSSHVRKTTCRRIRSNDYCSKVGGISGTQKLPGDMLVYSSDNCFISGTGTKA